MQEDPERLTEAESGSSCPFDIAGHVSSAEVLQQRRGYGKRRHSNQAGCHAGVRPDSKRQMLVTATGEVNFVCLIELIRIVICLFDFEHHPFATPDMSTVEFNVLHRSSEQDSWKGCVAQ